MSILEPPAGVKKTGGFARWLTRLQMAHGRKLVIALPYLWLILLFLLPFLIVLAMSVGDQHPHRTAVFLWRRASLDQPWCL